MCFVEISAADRAASDCAVTLQGHLCQQLREKGLRLMVRGTFLQLELSERAERPSSARARAKSDSSVRLRDDERGYSHARAHSDPQYWEARRGPSETTDAWAGGRDAATRTEKVLEAHGRPQRHSKGAPPASAVAAVAAGRKAAGKGKRGCAKPPPSPALVQERTTLMLKNLPSGYLRPELVALLEERGFVGRFSFVHVPVDCFSGSGLGYGFINMVDGDAAKQVHAQLQGFSSWKAKSQKVLEVHWGEEQGLALLVERYRNSRMMHPSVPDAYRPLLLENGAVGQFPPPTKRILKPRCMPRVE